MLYDKDLIILGQGPTRLQCPFDAEVWSVNNGYVQIARMGGHVSKIFFAHPQHKIEYKTGQGNAYDLEQVKLLISRNVEVYNTHKWEGVDHLMYPLDEIREKFGSGYFSDTICYMLAFALHIWTNDDVTLIHPQDKYRIRLYGVDMSTFEASGAGEYQLEKGGVEFWVGYAMGLGVKVEISDGSQVCQTITRHPYGLQFFDWDDIDPLHLLDRELYKGITF